MCLQVSFHLVSFIFILVTTLPSFQRNNFPLIITRSMNNYHLYQSSLVCGGELRIVNQDTDNEIFIRGSDLSIRMNIIMFTSENLKKNQLYRVYVNANNINGSAVSYVNLSEYLVHTHKYLQC